MLAIIPGCTIIRTVVSLGNIFMKKVFYLVAVLLMAVVLFRFTPIFFPITQSDIHREPFHSVIFYDRNGELLQEVLSQSASRSVFVPLEKISPYFIQAMIATEDRRFYRHHGVDYLAVFRAAWQNITHRRIVSGASTITLQLARLLHPAPRTLWNKLREAYRAYRLEAGMSKREILEEYLNRLPMGGNLYGVESAARTYFGIPASELTLAQASYLAAIPNSPNRYNPYTNSRGIRERQKRVLQQMVRNGFISSRRFSEVLKTTVHLRKQTSSFLAPHFVFHLMKQLPPGSNTVRTTIDSRLQRMVHEQVHRVLRQLKPYHVTNAAVLLVENSSGEVLAYLGSANYFDETIQGKFDGVQAFRQPGSALKPFLYQLAMEKGFNPASLISDISTRYTLNRGIYAPHNYSQDFHGPIRLREALANSLNIPAVRTLAQIGVEDFLRRLREYGFSSLQKDAGYYGVGLALGDGEVSLYQMVRAYSTLARYGRWQPLREVLSVNGTPVPRDTTGVHTISRPEFHFLIASILSDHRARSAEFGPNSVLNLPFPCAAKTGTSFRFCDNWTVGYTRDYTLGVWVGNFDNTPMMRVSGVTGAGPIFAAIMQLLYREAPEPLPFPVPPGVVQVSICPLSGKRPTSACPTRIQEWIPKRDYPKYLQEHCTMHIRVGNRVKVVLPERFREWAKHMGWEVQSSDSLAHQPAFRIVNPGNQSVYRRLSNLAESYQSIEFRLEAPDSLYTVRWYLNNQPLRVTHPPHRFLWEARPGSYHLRAEDAEHPEFRDEITFQVK